ncbi:hypothetical protein [Pseudoroseicyclus sp. CXY001]|uniref:hypothetical protein n=1 Tax=Pseudoroseicyclus sp. CXY001 TaxID=3242492 RepID=UPI003570C1C7
MLTRLAGAILRAVLVMLAVSAPAMLLPGASADIRMTVTLVALFVGLFTFVEYNAAYPSLLTFRDAAPFNRIRFGGLAVILVILPLMQLDGGSSVLRQLVAAIGRLLSEGLDFPYSPVRLTVLMMPEGAAAPLLDAVRVSAAMAYFISLAMLVVFIVYQRLSGWPLNRGGFNVWINLPTFDPTSGGDVVDRLGRDAMLNLIAGFLLPFIIPALVKGASSLFDPLSLAEPHTLIWMMTAWAFIPATLLMKGVALSRVAQMIRVQRLRGAARAAEGELAAA